MTTTYHVPLNERLAMNDSQLRQANLADGAVPAKRSAEVDEIVESFGPFAKAYAKFVLGDIKYAPPGSTYKVAKDKAAKARKLVRAKLAESDGATAGKTKAAAKATQAKAPSPISEAPARMMRRRAERQAIERAAKRATATPLHVEALEAFAAKLTAERAALADQLDAVSAKLKTVVEALEAERAARQV